MKKSEVLIIDNSPSITGALRSIVNIASDVHHKRDFCIIIPRHSNSRHWIEEPNMTDLSRRPASLFFYVLIITRGRLRGGGNGRIDEVTEDVEREYRSGDIVLKFSD